MALPFYSIAVFASGTGSNTDNIIKYFRENGKISIGLVVCNKPSAGVLKIAQTAGVDTLIIEKERFFKEDGYLYELQKHHIDFIVLAGFLWKIPEVLIHAYPKKIINIHPALLPAYGGKGMYGSRVHEAVIAAGDKKSGITIHFVDELYDHGETVLQVECEVTPDDTSETLAAKIHALEYKYYPAAIEKSVLNQAAGG